jgi:hypothetical protein
MKMCLLATLLSASLTVNTTGKTPTMFDYPTRAFPTIDIPSGSPEAV